MVTSNFEPTLTLLLLAEEVDCIIKTNPIANRVAITIFFKLIKFMA